MQAHGLDGAVLSADRAGQLKTASYTDLDVAAFITDTNRTLAWAAAGFNSTLQFAIPGSVCSQNTARQSICEAGLAELKPNEQYFFWVANGCGSQDQHPIRHPFWPMRVMHLPWGCETAVTFVAASKPCLRHAHLLAC